MNGLLDVSQASGLSSQTSSGQAGATQVRVETLRLWALVLAIFGTYTQFHLYSGDRILFPFVAPNLIGLWVVAGSMLQRPKLSVISMFLLIAVFLLAYLPEASIGGYFSSAFSKSIQLIASLFAGYGLYLLIIGIPRVRLFKLLNRLSMAILIVAALEVYAGFSAVVIAVNEFLYMFRPAGFYQETLRDMQLWGQIRPLVFATEPSLVGIWGAILMTGATLVSPFATRKRFIRLLVYSVLLVFIVRSVSTILIISLFYFATLFDRRTTRTTLLALAALITNGVLLVVFTPIGATLAAYISGTSFFARIYGPFLVAHEVLRINPFFGLGLGNSAMLEHLLFDVWSQQGFLLAASNYVERWGVDGMLTSNFFWLWINFGLVGGLILIILFVSLMRQPAHGKSRPALLVPLVTAIGVWMSLGGFVDVRSWFVVYFLIGCTSVAQRGLINRQSRADFKHLLDRAR